MGPPIPVEALSLRELNNTKIRYSSRYNLENEFHHLYKLNDENIPCKNF